MSTRQICDRCGTMNTEELYPWMMSFLRDPYGSPIGEFCPPCTEEIIDFTNRREYMDAVRATYDRPEREEARAR